LKFGTITLDSNVGFMKSHFYPLKKLSEYLMNNPKVLSIMNSPGGTGLILSANLGGRFSLSIVDCSPHASHAVSEVRSMNDLNPGIF